MADLKHTLALMAIIAGGFILAFISFRVELSLRQGDRFTRCDGEELRVELSERVPGWPEEHLSESCI